MIAMNEKANRTKVLAAVAVLAMVACVFVAMPMDETDAATDITYISGVIDQDTTFVNNNTVVVNDDLVINNGATLIIGAGTNFTVNEGVTLTIDGVDANNEKAKLEIKDGSTVTVNGSIEVGRNGQLVNDNAKTLTDSEDTTGFFVNGGLTVVRNGIISTPTDFDPEADSVPAIILGSSATFETQSSGKNHAVIENQAIVMPAGASVTLNGDFNNVAVIGYSSDSEFNSLAMITGEIPTGDAITTSYTRLAFTASVVDQTVYVADPENVGEAVQKTVKATVLDISGTTMSGTTLIVAAGESTQDCYQDEAMTIPALGTAAVSSSLNVVDGSTFTTACNLDVTGTLRINGTANIAGALTVATGATVTIAPAANNNVTITGVIYDSGSVAISPAEGVTVDISAAYLNITGGTATIAGYDTGDLAGFSGAYYTNDENGNAYFSEFADALTAASEAGAYDVYVGGYAATENIAESVYEITSDITVSDIDLYIENKVQVNTGVTLTINESASVNSVNGGLIIVEGTVTDNADSDFGEEASTEVPESGVAIDAEVRSTDEDETYYSYTTLANALSGMTSGTVYLFGNVDVDENLTIPENVTVDADGKTLTVENGVTLDIQGVLDITSANSAIVIVSAADNAVEGTVAVTNYIVYGTQDLTTDISGFYAAGAIGETEGNFVMSAAVAETNAADLGNITMYGTLTIEDVTFTNAEDTNKTVTINGNLTAGTVTIDGYNLIIADSAVYNGTVANAEGSVVLTNIRGITVADTTVEDADRLVISGTPVPMTAEEGKEAPASSIVFAGTVYMDDMALTALKDVTVPADAVVNVIGTVSGVTLLTVEGELNVMNEAVVTADDVNVIGTVTVADATEGANDAGSLTVDNVYAGITKDDVDNGNAVASTAAVINGTIVINEYAYVAPGATLSEGFTEGMNSAMFSVEGSEWFTVYSKLETTTVNKAPIANGYFLGWATEENGDVVYDGELETPVQIPLSADGVTYYSVGDYDIYNITVITDGNINAVSVGGVVLVKSGNVFVSMNPMTAGVKDISVVAKSGYTAENVEISGTGVSDGSVTLAGTTTTDIVIYITGTEQAPVETVSNDDGMGITDYLLIILVVLVIILAIFVALRMMRS